MMFVCDAAFKFWEELQTYYSPVVFCVTSEGGLIKICKPPGVLWRERGVTERQSQSILFFLLSLWVWCFVCCMTSTVWGCSLCCSFSLSPVKDPRPLSCMIFWGMYQTHTIPYRGLFSEQALLPWQTLYLSNAWWQSSPNLCACTRVQ